MPGKVKGLVHWCKKVTEGYRGGEVTNISSSWKNGLAFCALIHRFRPHLIDYGSLSPGNIYENNELAYSIAEKEFGIMSLLDPKDMVEMACPDRRSVAIYVSQLYDYFKDEQIVEREVEYKTQTVDITKAKDTTADITEPSSELIYKERNSKVAACSDGNSDNSFVENSGASSQGSFEESKSCDNVIVQPSDENSEVVRTESEDSISDIDEILEANAALLQEDIEDLKEETERGSKDDELVCSHERKISTDCDVCQEIQIPESINGTYNADAVLKAAVCAGIAAVAITAGGDAENESEGRQNDISDKSYSEEIYLSDIKENKNLPIPEIQITYIDNKMPAEEKAGTQVLVKSMEAVNNSDTIESVSPEVETKIKSMHQESIATSSSDSFQSAEYIIIDDNSQQNQGKINMKHEIEKEDADQLVLVLADADSSAELVDTYSNSMKKVGSVSSESFTSTSSLASSDSSGSSDHGRRDIVTDESINNKSPCILTSKGIIPARDSETEIYVDEDDEEPPALPAVGPPPLPVQTDDMPFTQEEIVIQGELEVLSAEPVSITIEDADKIPLHSEKNMEVLTAEKSDNLRASSVLDTSVSSVGNAAGREETSAQALSEKQINCGISLDTTEKSSSGLPLNVPTIKAETEKTVNPNILEIDCYQGHPSDDLQNESNFEIQPVLESSFPAHIDNPVDHSEPVADNTPIENRPVPVFIYEENMGEKDKENNLEIAEEKSSQQNSEEIFDKTVNEETQYPTDRAYQEPLHGKDFISTAADVNQTLLELEKESVTSSADEAAKIKPCVHEDVKEPVSEKDAVKETNNKLLDQSMRYDGGIFPDKLNEGSGVSTDSSDALKIVTVPVTTSFVNKELKMPSLVSKDNRVDISPIDVSHTQKSDSVMREPLVSEPTSAEVKDAFACKIQKETDVKPKKPYTKIPSNTDMNADVDLNLLKKAKEMSKRMAEKQIEIVQSPKLSEEVSKTPEAGSKNEPTTENSGIQNPTVKSSEREKEKEETRSRRLEILRQLQKSTRPTKKKIEAADIETSDSYSDSSADFKSKMKMWTRKSSTTQEPEEISSSSGSSTPDSASKKSFPSFPTSPVQTPSSPREDQSNLQKLTQSLPSKPRAGSVAEYVRKISQSSQSKPDYVTKSFPAQAKNLNDDTVILRRERPAVESRDKALFRRSTGTLGFTLSRPLRTTQPLNVSVKPLVKKYTGQEQNKDRSSTPPVSSPRSSRNSGDFSLIVKPLSEKYALSDEESKTKQQEEKKADLERKDSLSKRNPPKRNLSITRPRSRSGSRERNIWQHDYSSDVITSPAIEQGPSVARRDSFEVKVRPVSLQLSTDTSESVNNDNDRRRLSLSSGTSASEGNPKVNISVQPLSPRSRATSESSANELNEPTKLACDQISKSQSQAIPNVSVGAQDRQSRPRTSLAPRWTSKVDNSKSGPNAEPLGIAARQPGRSVLNYVQSCLTQKSTPKSLEDKVAGSSRPATFSSTDVTKRNIGDKRSVTGAPWSGNQPSFKQAVKVDSVSICNSIFGSKAKMKIDKDRIESLEKTHRNFSGDEADANKLISSENVKSSLTSDLPSLSLDDEAIKVKEIACEKILQEQEQMACQHEDAIKSKNTDKGFQDSIKDTPAELEKTGRMSESIRLPERDENKESMSESPKVLQSDEKSISSSSGTSSSSDTDSEKDKYIKESVSHTQIVKVQTGVSQPSLKEISERGAQQVRRGTEVNKADGTSSDKQSSISSASSIESIDLKRDVRITNTESEPAENNDKYPLKVRADVVSSVAHKATFLEKTSDDAVESDLQISAEEDVEHRDSQTGIHELKADIINQGKESGIAEKLKATKDTLLIDKSDKSGFESSENEDKNLHYDVSSPSTSSTSSAENENQQMKEDSRMADKKHAIKDTLEADQLDESESESSEREGKVICYTVSSQSTSSTSLAEIEKPELKEDLKGIILELEKELVNESPEKEHAINLQENDSCQIQVVDMEEPKVVAPASIEVEYIKVPMNDPTMTIDHIQDETEDVSEKDLLEDFDNLVSSLKKKEDDIFAKELEVVAEDETEETDTRKKMYSSGNLDQETSDKMKKKVECDAETGNGWFYCQKGEKPIAVQGIPELTSVGKESYSTVSANEIVILPSMSHEKEISPARDIEEDIVVHSQTTEVEISSSSSSSSSQSSSASLKEEAVDDELLRNIIEDAQPFKAPLLEEIIDSPKADKTIADAKDRRHQTCQPVIDSEFISGENFVDEAQESGKIEVSCEDNNNCSDNTSLVSVIRSEDPIILSAIADANDISSPLEVNVAVFEGSLQDFDRMSPVLFPEEEVLKQHGFTDAVDEKLEDDLVLCSAIFEAKAEERKDRCSKKSEISSSNSSDTENVSKKHAEKQAYEDSGTQKTKDNHDAAHSESVTSKENLQEKKKREIQNSSSESVKRTTDIEATISDREMEKMEMKDEEMEKLEMKDDNLEEQTDRQSVQSENESEDGMKYKFRGKDGNCYLLLDNDPTSPVAKTLISMEKEKSENLKNSSLSSMSDEQIQDAIDSINLKHSEYIPISGISVSLKNPEYFFDQKYDQFEVEFLEPQREVIIETEPVDSEHIIFENEKTSDSQDIFANVNIDSIRPDTDEFADSQIKESKSSEVGSYKQIKPSIQCQEPVSESDQGENAEVSESVSREIAMVNEAAVQYDPTKKITDIEDNDSVRHIQLSASETSSSSSSSHKESKPHKKKKKRKTRRTTSNDSENSNAKLKTEIKRSYKKQYTSSSESDYDGEPSSVSEKTIPLKKIKLVDDKDKGNNENKACHEAEQVTSVQNVNDHHLVNEHYIDLDFVKETVSEKSPVDDLELSSEERETLSDKVLLECNEHISDRSKTNRNSEKSESDKSSRSSSSSPESSESDSDGEKKVINIEKDIIRIDKAKSKVYHSDENLKSESSEESDLDDSHLIKSSETKEPLGSEFATKHPGAAANYENWPISTVQLENNSEEINLDIDKTEDLDNNEEFLIGREKDPSKSEVARLIQQSLEQDRKRDEIRRLEQDRYKELQDKLLPRDEVLEHEHMRHLSETSSGTSNKEDDQVDLDESSQSGAEDEMEEMVEEEDMSEELLAGEATPLTMPSVDEISSPDEQSEKPVVEVFDLHESSGDDISPDMESQALFVKLKEAQCKNAVVEAEMAKLKAKIIVLENTEGQKRQYEKKCEEMAARLLEMEKKVSSARKEINHYQDMMEGSQGQYIALEKKMQGDVTAIEKKYHKAKKIIKEYQQREKDFLAERESLLQQQTEKDQQYNALVKSLKDRIFQLEKELAEAQRAAGLPVLVPPQGAPHPTEEVGKKDPIVSEVIAKVAAPVAQSTPLRVQDSGSPVMSPTTETASVSSESDNSVSEPISLEADMDVVDGANTFESIPKTQLLDTSASRDKAQLASAIPSRRPPTKQRSKSQESIEGADDSTENKNRQSGLESWTRHDSEDTVIKSDLKKRKAQQQGAEAPDQRADTPPPESLPPPPPPPSAPAPSLPDSDDASEHRDRQDSMSGESSSTVSQTSYDPSKPSFRGMDSEIPASDSVSIDTAGTAETAGSGSSAGAAGPTFTKKSKGIKIPKLPFKFGGGEKDTGGVTLVSNRSLNTEEESEGGVTLISKKKLDSSSDFNDGASTISDVSSSYMVGELDEGGKSSTYNLSGTPAVEENPSQTSRHNQNQISSGAISQWNNENVCHWLLGIEMEKYTPLFKEKSITGIQLALLDANKLKAMGITDAKDRDIFKKKIKELKVALDKERKQMEKERKQKEKEQKARQKEQKKGSKKK